MSIFIDFLLLICYSFKKERSLIMSKISEKYPSLEEIEKIDILLEQEKYVKLLKDMVKKHRKEQQKTQIIFTGELNKMNIGNDLNASWKRAMILFVALANGYSVDETNTYLEKAGMAKLYPRDLFDSCVIFSLKNNIGAKDFEDFYSEAKTHIVISEKPKFGSITINKLKNIIKESSESESSKTVHITDEIASLVMNCTNQEEFFDFVANELSPVLSETYQLQRRYVCLYVYYALMARAEEIYTFIEDLKKDGPLSKEILHALNSHEEITCEDYWHDFMNIINMKIRRKIEKLEEAEQGKSVYGYSFKEGEFDSNAVYEVLASSLSDPLSLFKSTISTKSENEDDAKEKIEKLKQINSRESFYDAPISLELFWKFLYGSTSKEHEVKDDSTNKKRANNNGSKLKQLINGDIILSRSSFVFLLTSIAAYLDNTTYKIKNTNHKLSINRINEILVNSHFAPLNTGDSVDIATLLYFFSKEKNAEDEVFNYFDFFDAIDVAEEGKIKMLYLSEFKAKENQEKIEKELKRLK